MRPPSLRIMASSQMHEDYGKCADLQYNEAKADQNHDSSTSPRRVLDLQNIAAKLPLKDVAFLDSYINSKSKPLTTDVLLASTLHHVKTYDRKWFQETLRKLDPLFSHIKSFSSIVDILVQTNPMIPGLIWGSLHLAITVCCRSMILFDRFVGMLADFAPALSFFSRSKELFEELKSGYLEEAMEAVCKEIVCFCLRVVKYCQRYPFVNFLRVLFQPSLELEFQQCIGRLKAKIALAEKEVAMCDMQATKNGFHEVQMLVRDVPGRIQQSKSSKKLIRMIPYSQSECFFGRQNIIQGIAETLDPARLPKRQRKFALYGLAGCGKTQIALEYVYTHCDDYEIVLWISSSSVEKIEKDFAEAAVRLGHEKSLMLANEARQYVLQSLGEMDANYLIVFDNVEDVSLIRNYWPCANHGSIIITSRDSVSSKRDFIHSAAVTEFTVEEGCAFLATLLPTSMTPGTETDMVEITKMLGGFPLALSQVAAYTLSEDCPLSTFLSVYRDQRKQQEFVTRSVSDYELTLATVWSMSFSTLNPDCEYLLGILVFFDPDAVPYKLLTEGACSLDLTSSKKSSAPVQLRRLQILADEEKFQRILITLRKQSLIRTNSVSSSFTIHRLVQEYASHKLSGDSTRERAVFADALALLASAQPKDDCTRHWSAHLWEAALVYLPHVRALESKFQRKPTTYSGYENDLAKLLFNCASYLFERNRYTVGLEIIESARKIAVSAQDLDYKLLSDLYRLEGRLCNEANMPQRGLQAFENAFRFVKLVIDAGQLPLNDTRYVRTLTGWGNCLNQLEQFDEALDLQLQASQACATEPEKHGDAESIVLLNLGYVYFRRGDLKVAEDTLWRAHKLDKRLQPVLYALANLAIIRGQLEYGLGLHMDALRLYIEAFGEQHQCVADSLFKVGETYLKMGNKPDAILYLDKSLDMYRSEGRHFDARAAISRGARMLALARQMPTSEQSRRVPEPNKPSVGDLLKESFNLHRKLTGKSGPIMDTDDDYASLMFYWSR